ncbi:hypothetical protein Ahy_B04g072893 [Arachis hypogaea]|uniref:Uncharacterized protein n=1 Tax=Arachis hypogaea TaxID=3818 RepID=A0A444ZNZ5_ARAHY|nr:hypothetical protein Ahy_B04g072893 [Arachis hypogaea]
MLYNEMKRALRQSVFILMRKLSWRFFGHKINLNLLNSSISRNKREDKLVDATKNTRFLPPLGVPSYKQALVYAKKEIDNTPLVNEDPDLYAS